MEDVLCVLYELDDGRCRWDDGCDVVDAFYGSPHGTFIGQVPWVTREDIYSGCYMESGQLRSLNIRNTNPRLDPDVQPSACPPGSRAEWSWPSRYPVGR